MIKLRLIMVSIKWLPKVKRKALRRPQIRSPNIEALQKADAAGSLLERGSNVNTPYTLGFAVIAQG